MGDGQVGFCGGEWRVMGGGSSEGRGWLGGFVVAEQTACVFEQKQVATGQKSLGHSLTG
jgi:hypothetical protein